MNDKPSFNPILGEKIPLVGRKAELDYLRQKLEKRGDNDVVYIRANGGIGKTRILAELESIVEKLGPGYLCTGIIDLYHNDNHSTSALEQILIDRFDRENKYFQEYRRERQLYTSMRERGTGAERLEQMREHLIEILVKEWNQLSIATRKLVLIFDTVELLQYESSQVEELAGLEKLDTLVKPWMMKVLPQLSNVLVVFAGRPREMHLAVEGQPGSKDRMEQSILKAFKDEAQKPFEIKTFDLQGLTLKETENFISRLCGPDEVIPKNILPVVRHLTNGAPIFLHLIVDLMRRLAEVYQTLLTWFQEHAELVNLEEGDSRLEDARQEIKAKIVRGIFNESDVLGLYLTEIAMIPKGIDCEILNAALGIPGKEALELLDQLKNLSFVKSFLTQSVKPAQFEKRLFLHDEMYDLFRVAKVVPNRLVRERQVANTLVNNFYDPKIRELEEKIEELDPNRREEERRTLQLLRVERLYYLLLKEPARGYSEYKQLSDEANRNRYVGYSMRLHDEFLRFYADQERRDQLKKDGVGEEQIIRESAEMWIERLHWWGQGQNEIKFAEKIFANLENLHIDPRKNADILGNIAALAGRATAMFSGYDQTAIDRLTRLLDVLESQAALPKANPRQRLAQARLLFALGYLFDSGGRLREAARYYVAAQNAFDTLDGYKDELAMLLNNLSYVYARQGRFDLAMPLVRRGLSLSQTGGTQRSTALALSTWATIELSNGSHLTAIQLAVKAKTIFDRMSDSWGQMLTLRTIGNAKRKLAKAAIRRTLPSEDKTTQKRKLLGSALEEGRDRDMAEEQLRVKEACKDLEEAISMAEKNGFKTQLPQLYIDLGTVYREIGRLAQKGFGSEPAAEQYDKSDDCFERAIALVKSTLQENQAQAVTTTAEALVHSAELHFYQGAEKAALEKLDQAAALFDKEYQVCQGADPEKLRQTSSYLLPQGKMERLRGEIAFTKKDKAEGLRHFYLAFIYFNLFSPSAIDKESVIDYLYQALLSTGVEERQNLFEDFQAFVKECYPQFGETGFIETLRNLLG